MDNQDADLIMLLASSSASLAEVPGKNNWIEKADGDLPPYVRKLARGIMKSGKSKSQAIAIAISRIKVWAAGGDDVDADTRAKAAKAVAQWEALKAKNKAKKLVKASRDDGSTYLMLSNVGSFNTDLVRQAWNIQRRSFVSNPDSPVAYSYIRELWTDHIIVDHEEDGYFEKVPYTVTGTEVSFGDPIPVKQVWAEESDTLTAAEKRLLAGVLRPAKGTSHLAKLSNLAQR